MKGPLTGTDGTAVESSSAEMRWIGPRTIRLRRDRVEQLVACASRQDEDEGGGCSRVVSLRWISYRRRLFWTQVNG